MSYKNKLNKNIETRAVFLGLSRRNNKIYYCFKDDKAYLDGAFLLSSDNYHKTLINFLIKQAKDNNFKIFSAGLSSFSDFEEIATLLWQELDIVPKEVSVNKGNVVQNTKTACNIAASLFDDELKPVNFFDKYGQVREQFLTNLDAYKKIATREDWNKIIETAKLCQSKNLKMAFINSTAAGGGVALMRHALIRFYKLLGVSVKWIVLEGDTDIFTITKKKIHNVLHGIAAHDIMLERNDKIKYNKWIKDNFEKIEKALEKLDVIFVDDPQPSGLIPLIKKKWPEKKIIYRSHTQIYSRLIDAGVEQNKNSWDFVWNNAKLADIFISHPIKQFTPKDVPENKIVYLPATTDRLDGLNKDINKTNKKYYYTLFNSILVKSGLEPLDLKRPYIIQVARFDPAKGIPDVIESYRKLRKYLHRQGIPDKKMPQLVIVGNGANDDPESVPIYQEVRQTLGMDTFKKFRDDIKVARLPHNDQLLNTLLSGAKIALQLSHREGFEIKVTEALMKGVPVVAYKTGGIPLQIRSGETGYLVPRGKTKEVAHKLENLLSDKLLYQKMSKTAKNTINDDYLTINSAYCWLFLSLLLNKEGNIEIRSRDFKKLEKKYLAKILTN